MVAEITGNTPEQTFPDHIDSNGVGHFVSEADAEFVASEPKPFDTVMVDIETMSLHRHKALVLSIGMVEFDPKPLEGPRFGAEKLIIPHFMSQVLLGRRIDVGTQKFWAEQPHSARNHWQYPSPATVYPLHEAIETVREFCINRKFVWANGTQFDLSILDGLAEDLKDSKELWHYRAPSDMRTLRQHVEPTRIKIDTGVVGVLHEPIYDCKVQAWEVWARQH